MLKRIRVTGYKSLRDVDIDLRPLTVLLGPNAAGKSNFLDLLQLLSRMASSRTLKEAFDSPCRGLPIESFSFGAEGIGGLLKQEAVRFRVEVDVELSPAVIQIVEKRIRETRRGMGKTESASRKTPLDSPEYVKEGRLRYAIEVEMSPKSGILRVADEYLAALNSKGEPTGKRRPFIESVKDRIHLRMEGQAHPIYMERGLDHSVLSRPHYPPHYPHLVAMREELASWLFFYFEPRERMRASNPVKEVRHIGLTGEELAAFLNTLKSTEPRQFSAVERALHAIIPSISGIDVSVNDLGEVELRIREGDIPVPARVVSEGTLRILGMLALSGAKEPSALIGFEEPENGVHPRRIQLIADMLRTRTRTNETQVIVTTHSTILCDMIPPDDLYVCRKKNGTTTIEPFAAQGPLLKSSEIDRSLVAPEEEETPVSQRILRGDFDA